MAEKRLQALAVASDYLAASGAVQAIFRSVFAAKEETSVQGLSRLTVTVDPQEDAYASVAVGKVLECNYTDGNFSEFRITGITETTRRRHGSKSVIVAVGPRYDLLFRAGIAERVEADGFADASFSMYGLTVSEWVTEILASRNVPAYFSKGTISPTTTHQLSIANMTPLDALEQLADVADCELAIEALGYGDELLLETGDKVLLESSFTLLLEGSNMKVEMGTIGSDVGQATTSDKALLHGMKNMTSLRRSSDAIANASKQATQVFPIGGPEDGRFTIADNSWKISSVAASTTMDLASDTFGAPMNEDDQLNGYYIEKPDGSLLAITDSTVANNRLTFGSSHGLSAGARVTIRANSDGDDLTWLDSPSAQTTYGKWVSIEDRSDYPNVSNLLDDSVGASYLDGTYLSGIADGWNQTGSATLTENTSNAYYRHGSSSQKVVATAAGGGIISDAVTVAPSTARPNMIVSVWLMVTAKENASTFVKVQLEDDTNTVLFPLDSEDAATTSVIGRWTRIDIVAGPPFYNFVSPTVGSSVTACKVKIASVGGTATFYVDAVSLENTPRIQPAGEIVQGRAANGLWQEALTVLANRKNPIESFDLGIVDLSRLDTTSWPNDDLVLGATVVCVDENLGIDTEQRVTEIKRDLLTPGRTKVQLAAPKKTLRELVKPRKRGPFIPPHIHEITEPTRLTNTSYGTTGKIASFGWKSGYPFKPGGTTNVQWHMTWEYLSGVGTDWDLDLYFYKNGVRVDDELSVTATANTNSLQTATGHWTSGAYYHVVGILMDGDDVVQQTVQTSVSLALT